MFSDLMEYLEFYSIVFYFTAETSIGHKILTFHILSIYPVYFRYCLKGQERATNRQNQDVDLNVVFLSVLQEEELSDYFNHLYREQKKWSVPKKIYVCKIFPNRPSSDSTIFVFSHEDSYWRDNVQHVHFKYIAIKGVFYIDLKF